MGKTMMIIVSSSRKAIDRKRTQSREARKGIIGLSFVCVM